MKLIPLSKGKAYAIVDDADFEYLNQRKWKLQNGRACRNQHLGKRPGTHWKEDKRIDRTVYMHREIMGNPEGMDVDHKNLNSLDNRRSNLRVCTHHQNTMNQLSRGGASDYKGVYWDSRKARWYTQITFMGKGYTLALFESETEAAKEYDHVAKQLHGEFANLNFKEAN